MRLPCICEHISLRSYMVLVFIFAISILIASKNRIYAQNTSPPPAGRYLEGVVRGQEIGSNDTLSIPLAGAYLSWEVVGGDTTIQRRQGRAITNQEGGFLIGIPQLPIRLRISYIGYLSQTRLVTNNTPTPLTIRLRAAKHLLPEVTIYPNPDSLARSLVTKAYTRLLENKQPYFSKGFYRKIQRNEKQNRNTYEEVLEATLDVEHNAFGVSRIALINSRYGLLDSSISLNNSMLILASKVGTSTNNTKKKKNKKQIPKPLGADPQDIYQFTLEGTISYEGRQLAIIHAHMRNNKAMPRSWRTLSLDAEIYIDLNSYDLMRITQKLRDPDALLLKTNELKLTDYRLETEHVFRRDTTLARTVLEHMHYNQHFITTLQEHTTELRHKKGEHFLTEVTSTVFFHHHSKQRPHRRFKKLNTLNDLTFIRSRSYDPDYWTKQNPSIAYTANEKQILKAFEEQKIFGTMDPDSPERYLIPQELLNDTTHIEK